VQQSAKRWLTNSQTLFAFIAFLLVALLAYAPIVNTFFLSDDFAQIGKVLGGDLSFASFTWGEKPGGFFRPVFILSYALDAKLWGTNPVGYHLTNVAIHGSVSFLVAVLAAQLMERAGYDAAASRGVAVVAGLIFLVTPSHTEAVSWISGRADLLAAFFSLGTIIVYLLFTRERRLLFLIAACVLFALALLSKESAVCVPLIIVVIELFLNRKRVTLTIGTLFLTLLGYAIIRYAALGTFIGVYGAGQHLNFRPSLIWERLPKYFIRALLGPLPEQLSFMLIKPFRSTAFIVFAIAFAGLLAGILVLRHKRQPDSIRKQQNAFLLLLLILFLCALVPVVTMGISVFDTSGERFVYLPSAFTAIAVAYVLAVMIPRRARVFAVCLALLFYSVSLYTSNARWRAAASLSKSLLDNVTSQSTQSAVLVLNAPDSFAGVPVYRNGLDEALKSFQNSKKIDHVDVVSTHTMQNAADVAVERNQNETATIILANKSEFSRVNASVECVEVMGQTKQSLSIRMKECARGMDVFFFKDGRMIKMY
jgi:hypothetical protein